MSYGEDWAPPLPYTPTKRETEIAQRLRDLADDIQSAGDHRRGHNIAVIHGIYLRPEMTLAEASAEGMRYAIKRILGIVRTGGIS